MTSKQSNTRANKKWAKGQIEKEKGNRKRGREEKRANKTARVKWGEENERQMANNVMREIGIVMGTWYVDFCVDLPGNGARNPSCYLLSTALVFP